MDFWSRLIANTPLSSRNSTKDAARDPIKRRQRFEKEYSQLLHTWRNCSNLARDVDAAEILEIRLQELTNILAEESRRPLPHPCLSFAATKQIYIPIAKIATTSYNEWIIKEAVLFFASLIDSEEEESFVENDAFSASLTNLLVRITGANSIRLGQDTEVKVVELAFNITTKIRLEPEILPAWFKIHHSAVNTTDTTNTTNTTNTITTNTAARTTSKFRDDREKFAGKTQKQDFPLFYLLMDYIHHEGRVGDFARTGLLYIIEAASNSIELEQWIVESDLSTLMATGLGALYSQLSRKLVIDHPPQGLPPVLAFSDYEHPTTTFEVVSSCSPDYQLHMDTFLSHLLFWQDVLNHCRSLEVKSTLLEHFQIIFLQQLLYPSLLESSDADGGSSVAVLTYLRRILESLDHPDMINLILHYLLALPDTDASSSSQSFSEPAVSAARKRKSMDLASMMASKMESSYSPLLFNLVDLIHSCLQSENSQTVCVTMQLVATILKRHHRYAIVTLLHTEGVDPNMSHRTMGAHQQEVDFLMTLAGTVGGQDNFDEVYDTILKDTMTRVEGHPCSLRLVAPRVSTHNHKLPAIPDSLPGAPRDVPPHTLRPEDPLLHHVLDILEQFFINPVETNLSATETVLDLAVCGYMSIEGWLLRHPRTYVFDEDLDEPASPSPSSPSSPLPLPDPASKAFKEREKLEAISRCRRRPKWQSSHLPRILVVLETLADQVVAFRESIPRFDELMQQRREAFQTADAIVPNQQQNVQAATAGAATADSSSHGGSRSASPARPSALGGFQRILSELSTPSRSGSPHGRKEAMRSSGGGGGGGFVKSGSHRATTPTSNPIPVPPKEFPLNHESPHKSGLSRSLSPGSHDEPGLGGRGHPVASQVAAFAAVDQGILAGRVGLPKLAVEPIPLDFSRNEPSTHERLERDENKEAEDEIDPTEAQVAADEDEIEENPEQQTAPSEKDASVSHIITNVIVYQSFLLELASLIQVRAGLFNEVRFA
ncbi:Retinoic acid induced 16-like protein-domain-containing protein [Xylaria curta]|nr:Retinoic acid induced 16-like protein-domain-containing protein [Xylaria curta]